MTRDQNDGRNDAGNDVRNFWGRVFLRKARQTRRDRKNKGRDLSAFPADILTAARCPDRIPADPFDYILTLIPPEQNPNKPAVLSQSHAARRILP